MTYWGNHLTVVQKTIICKIVLMNEYLNNYVCRSEDNNIYYYISSTMIKLIANILYYKLPRICYLYQISGYMLEIRKYLDICYILQISIYILGNTNI